MNIIFLCGSLETGKDGVGDYTKRLAGELIRQGHQCGIIALMDKFIDKNTEEEQESEQTAITVFRLPFKNGVESNCNEAKKWVDKYDPSWISLQFVPFAFHSKGLPFRLSKYISRLTHGHKLHIMFHELWVGMNKEASLKLNVWGLLQRELLVSFIKKTSPSLIHTQTRLYREQLKKAGTNAALLPLFSNIKVLPAEQIIKDPNYIKFVVFGGIHPGVPISELAQELKDFSIAKGIRVVLRMLGRCGVEQLHWEEECRSAGLEVEVLGEQSQELISAVLSNSTFGISTTPASLIEKSGAVAAMREHGLSILCISGPWHPRGIKEQELPPDVVVYRKGEIHDFIIGSNKSNTVNNISTVAREFVNQILLSI